MIEVLFADSESASMKAAKSTVIYSKADSPTSAFISADNEPSAVLARAFGECREGWLEGSADGVVCFGYRLDIGNIQKDIEGHYRKNLIFSMLDMETEEEIQNYADSFMQMQRLKIYLEAGESIRIWYSNAPYSRCGLYHLCNILHCYENEIHLVELHGKTIVFYRNWGEVAAEEFAGFLSGERILSKEEIQMYAFLWNELVEENSPLRAMVNGKMMGVPENFYDFMIFNRLTTKPVKECRLIGDIIGHNQVSIGDWWYAKRIQHFIEEGLIKVLEDAKRPYARLICLANQHFYTNEKQEDGSYRKTI